MSFEVRLATSGDAARLAELRLEFLSGEGVVDDASGVLTVVTAYLERTIASSEVVAFLGEADGSTVASGVVTIYERMMWSGVGREGYVLSMYTQPAYRRRGIGSAIVDEIMSFAREHSLRLALIATDEGRPLYERVGFTHETRYLRWRA